MCIKSSCSAPKPNMMLDGSYSSIKWGKKKQKVIFFKFKKLQAL